MTRALIMSCSARKRFGESLMPAYERYNGPAWQLLRKFVRENDNDAGRHRLPFTVALSAKFGFIFEGEPIPYYQQLMTERRAEELLDDTSQIEAVRRLLVTDTITKVFVHGGRTYKRCAREALKRAGFKGEVITPVTRGLGASLGSLRIWLLNA